MLVDFHENVFSIIKETYLLHKYEISCQHIETSS